MSSSPSPASSTPTHEIPAPSSQGLPFPYLEVIVPASQPDFYASGIRDSTEESDSDAGRLAAEAADRETQARSLGWQQGELAARTKFDEQIGRERVGVAEALADFARERAAYYQAIESEAVKLSLSIARKILHREAQVDPLLLAGIVRVALERLEGATGVKLAVHPHQVADWQRYLASRMEPGDLPEIVEDAGLPPDRCRLQTSMGTTELGLEVQLKEIEQGLMDLMAARPGGEKS